MKLILTRGDRGSTTVVFDFWRRGVLSLFALTAFSATPIFALSVFDIIQLSDRDYSDQAILDLIQTTDSAFELEAEDLPKLKQLGVSEPVLRAMLERPAAKSSDSEINRGAEESPASQTGPKSESSRTHGSDAEASDHEHAARDSMPAKDDRFTAHAGHHLGISFGHGTAHGGGHWVGGHTTRNHSGNGHRMTGHSGSHGGNHGGSRHTRGHASGGHGGGHSGGHGGGHP